MPVVLTDNAQRVRGALENPKYQWRTLEGLAQETQIPSDEIAGILAIALSSEVVTTLDKSGKTLYTTRQHYQHTQPLWNRLLDVLSDQIK